MDESLGRGPMPPFAARLRRLSSAPHRLLWAVRVRWLVISGFLLLALAAHALGLFASITPVVGVAVIGGLLNAINEWSVRRQRYIFPVTAVAIPFDNVCITFVIIHTGGVQSPFLMLYVVQVVATAMLVDTVVAAGSAVLAILLWTAAVSWQAVGYLAASPLFPPGVDPSPALYHGTWAACLFYCLALLVYLGGYISERLRASERDLAEKNQRLQDALSSLRVAHAESTAAYARLQQAEAQLVHSEKMRSLGQLVAGVAHELNNPISFVSGNIEHLRSSFDRLRQVLEACTALPLPADERTRLEGVYRELRLDDVLADLPGLLDDCEEGARRTKHIVNELRTFSRSDERQAWRPADLHRGIESTIGLLGHLLKDRIRVHRDFAEISDIECLPDQLNQVFMNLLANAADAIDRPTGNIWISTRALPPDGSPERHEEMVAIAIRDDGRGMPPETQAKVFDPFFTTKEVGQGTGLGLSVSYGIIERHRGTFSVESTPGTGSTFTITLPVRQRDGERQ